MSVYVLNLADAEGNMVKGLVFVFNKFSEINLNNFQFQISFYVNCVSENIHV